MSKLKFIHDLSIKNKIILIILSISFLIHSIGFIFITIWDINRIKLEIQTGLTLNTKLVANNCIVPLTFGDNQQATEALSHLKNIKSIETACLFDKQGNLFASYPDTLNTNSILPFHEQQDNVLKDGFFYAKELVVYQNETYGTLCIKANSKPLKIAKRKIITTLILLSIVLDVLVIILASMMQRYISSPIIKLKKHFDKVAKNHDFSAIIIKQSNDEIGSLYDGFNNLTKQIQIRSKERDAAEENYKNSQNKLDLALHGGEIGIWEWDLKTGRMIWDARMEKMFGLEAGEFKQTYEAFKECLHLDDIAIVENEIKNAIDEIRPYDIIYRVIWKNKEIKYIKAKALISKDKKGKNIKMIGVCFDITEIKKAEEELKKNKNKLEDLVNERTKELELKYAELEKKGGDLNDSQKALLNMVEDINEKSEELEQQATKLEIANKELESFSYSVSHDLRAPLRGIDGFSQALLEDYGEILDEQGKDYLSRVRKGSQKMALLIDEMLNLSRLGRMILNPVEVNLSAIALSICEELRETDTQRKSEFIIAADLKSIADPTLMRAVLQNLIENAWKFTSKIPVSKIEFGEIEIDGKISYFVKDNGAGFDMKYKNKLFMPFQRLHQESEFSGTGIGLTTVQRIIRRHNGILWAESEVDAGATFYFTLNG